MVRKGLYWAISLLLVLMVVVTGCATPEPQVVEKIVKETVVVEKEKIVKEAVEVEKEVTRVVEVAKEVTRVVEVAAKPEPAKQAKYVFLFIGDGMAVAQRNAAELYLAATSGVDRPEDARLLMNSFPVQGMNTTYDLTSVIPDSASTGTALASGFKTASGVVGMDGDRRISLKNISEKAKEAGWKVGIISSVSIDHATPASFYAHQASRNDYYEISVQLANSPFDYFAGGPAKKPTGNDKDKPNVYEMAEKNGLKVTNTTADFRALKPGAGRVWVVSENPQDSGALYYEMDRAKDDPSLADYVDKGIQMLNNDKGFFMSIESGKIDWACHANDAAASIHDTLQFDEAIAVAFKFYQQHPEDTLIVVTGDHETGGMTIGFAGTQYDSFVDKIAKQTMSQTAFNDVLAEYKANHTAANAKLADLYDEIKAAFGFEFLTEAETEALKAKAEAKDEEAAKVLAMAISPLELATLEQSFVESMLGEEVRSSDPHTYLLYGGYEPLAIKCSTILNQKAGIAWTSYSHTGIPVQTSAVGVGAEMFAGYYDQTDINVAMLEIAGL